MVKENGRVGKVLKLISMKVIIVTIRSMVMVCLLGQAVTHTKENIRMMREMAMER